MIEIDKQFSFSYIGAPATGGAGIMQPQQVPFDVNALGRRVPLAHITLPPPPAMPKKDDDSDTSSSESSDRGSVRDVHMFTLLRFVPSKIQSELLLYSYNKCIVFSDTMYLRVFYMNTRVHIHWF